MQEQAQDRTTAPPRGFLRRWRVRFALAALALVLLVACLPWIAGAFAPGFAARAFAERFQGRLEIGGVELSWFGRQAVRGAALLDPEGKEVARLEFELPSLWQLARGGGRELGTLRGEVRAALVADEQGITNLERALAPRAGAPAAHPESSSTTHASAAAPEPELELELTSPLCSWSDARTRAAGKPFEIRDLRAHLALHPGVPAHFEVHAQLSGEQPGTLELRAEVEGLRTQGGAGFTKARASGKLAGFSSAMLDGLAQQHGRLEQILGPSVDCSFEAVDLGPTSGTLSLALQSQRTHLSFEGRVQDGLLRCTDQRGLVLELGAPRAFAAGFLEPLLPAGSQLVWPDVDDPWKLECTTLALPLPAALPTNAAGWTELLARLELDARLSIPGPIGFQNGITRGINLQPALSGLACRVIAGSGLPLSLTLDANLIAGETGKFHAQLQAADAWTPLRRGELPVVDAQLGIEGLSNAALDALIGKPDFLSQAFGHALDLHLQIAQASLAGGALDATLHSANIDVGLHGTIADGKFVGAPEHGIELHFGPPLEWVARQLAPFLPPGAQLRLGPDPLTAKLVNLELPLRAGDLDACLAATKASFDIGVPAASCTLADARTLALGASALHFSLGSGGRCALRFDTQLLQPGPAHCTLQGDFPALSGLLRGELPPLSFDCAVEPLATSSLDPWLTRDGRVPALLGEALELRLRGEQFGPRGGSLDLLATSRKLDLRLSFAGDKGVWRAAGADKNRVHLALEGTDLERELKSYLPPGTTLALDPQHAALDLELSQFELQWPPDPAQPLASLRLQAKLALPTLSFANELTRQVGITPSFAQGLLTAQVGEHGACSASFDARIGGAGDARLHAEVQGDSLASGHASLKLEGLPCSIADALCGKPAAVSGLLGETLDLAGDFASSADGKGSLSFQMHAPHGEAGASGKLEPGALVLAEPEGLHLRLDPTDAWFAAQLAGALPAGASLRRAQGTPKPFDLRLHAPRIALPQGTQTWIAALSGTAAKLEAALPDLSWSESGSAPLELRDLALRTELTQQPGSTLRFSGKIAGDPPGDLLFELRALDALTLLGEENGPDRFRIAAHAVMHGLPVGVVDALAGQGGLLVEALGARADLTLESAGISRQQGAFVLELVSPQTPVHFDGVMRDGMLRIEKRAGATARFGLGPLTSTKFVGRMVPLVCEVTKPTGAAPASVEVDALALPLDGDLSKLDGSLRLDLGEVSFALLPGLKGLFGSQAAKAVHVAPITLPIVKGVVRYDKLVLPIGGHEFSFHGNYSLVDGGMQLATEIPLELLGVKVSPELDKARGVIDGKTLVPIEIRGTFSKPHFAVGQGFLDSTVKKALENGLEGLFKKKPK